MAGRSSDASPSEMPSPKQEEKPSNNWWDSWITTAKNKSAEVYTMVKKDLDEIGTAVKSEASHVFSTTSNVLGKTLKLDEPESTANVMKKSLSTFIGQVSTALNPEPDDDDDDTEVILCSGDTTMFSTYKKELEALQRVDATFIVPANSPEFDAWKASLELSEDGHVISPSAAGRRLQASALLRAQYDKMVPDAVSHEDFWERYMFRVALLQDRLAAPPHRPTRDPVVAHLPPVDRTDDDVVENPKKVLTPEDTEVTPVISDKAPVVGDNVTWDSEDFGKDVELTEEQQILLLEEYEKEICSKKQTKQTSTNDNNNTKNKTTNTKSGNKNKNTKNNNKQKQNAKNKNGGKAPVKTDVCGNNLVEDYFAEKEVPKDDASANSDESWEKEFEIDEVQKA